MGLNMYLEARKEIYISRFEDDSDGAIELKLPEELRAFGGTWCELMSHTESYTVGYWSKSASHIYEWFMNNCDSDGAYGQGAYIDRDDFMCLLEACDAALANPRGADQQFPIYDGQLDAPEQEEYFEDIKKTKSLCEKALEFLDDREQAGDYSWSFYYRVA